MARFPERESPKRAGYRTCPRKATFPASHLSWTSKRYAGELGEALALWALLGADPIMDFFREGVAHTMVDALQACDRDAAAAVRLATLAEAGDGAQSPHPEDGTDERAFRAALVAHMHGACTGGAPDPDPSGRSAQPDACPRVEQSQSALEAAAAKHVAELASLTALMEEAEARSPTPDRALASPRLVAVSPRMEAAAPTGVEAHACISGESQSACVAGADRPAKRRKHAREQCNVPSEHGLAEAPAVQAAAHGGRLVGAFTRRRARERA